MEKKIKHSLAESDAPMMIDEQDNNQENVGGETNKENESKGLWDYKCTKFMLAAYLERRDKFRSPLVKTLYREIQKELACFGYPDIKADAIDRKMRNIKVTHERKKSKKQTGQSRDTWIWFKDAAEIFDIDKSMNSDEGVSSMPEKNSNCDPIDFSKNKLLRTLSFKDFLDDCDSNSFLSYIHFLSSSYDAFSDSDLDNSIDGDIMPSNAATEDSDRRSQSRRRLNDQRSQALELGRKKIQILENIERKCHPNDGLNEKIGELKIKAQNRRAAALENRNTLLEEKNEILVEKNELLLALLRSKHNT